MKRCIHASYETRKIDSKLLAPYRGYKIEKSWEVDRKGRVVKDTILYSVLDDEDDWIGDEYRTLEDAKAYIKELTEK